MSKNMLDENLLKISERADRIVTDPTTAGILLCYMLYRVEEPVGEELLYDIAVTGGIINYFTYQDAMLSLKTTEAVKEQTAEDGEKQIALTPVGVELARRLKTIAKKSYRDQIVTAAKKAVKKEKHRKDVRISYEPHENGVHLHVVLQDGTLTLLELKLFTPDQHQAEQLAERILTDPTSLYHDVIKAMMRKYEDTIDLSDN